MENITETSTQDNMSEQHQPNFYSIQGIKRANERSGFFWFEPATLRFFRSRFGSNVYGGKYFVSSEQFDENSPRLYTIRVADVDGSIDTVGEFQAYRTNAEAVREIKRLLKEQK